MSCLIDICICTFQRPQLTETLTSLAKLTVPAACTIRIVVIDNDDTPSAQLIVTQAKLPFDLDYIHAPRRNISIARNSALDAARGDFLAFLDDDEIVSTDWLVQIFDEMTRSNADVVFGTVVSVYPEQTESWLVKGDYHSTKPPILGKAVLKTGCSANVLLRRGGAAFENLRFDLALGRSGGEDTVFFRQVFEAGGKMTFAEKARVFEKVDSKRLSLAWLLRRKLRSGQSYAWAEVLTASVPWKTRIGLMVKAGAKAIYCGAMGMLNAFHKAQRNSWLIRGALHVGVVTKCIGIRERVHYGGS